MTNDQTVTQADERAADEWYPDRSATMHRKLAKLLARHRTAHSGDLAPGLERAAQWHDARCKGPSVFEQELHEVSAKALRHLAANPDATDMQALDMAQSGEGRSNGAGEDAIERVAQWLHDEGGFGDSWTAHTWPEHPGDTGQREGGWVKIVPSDVQAQFRDVARRLLTQTSAAALSAPQGEVERFTRADVEEMLTDYEWQECVNCAGTGATEPAGKTCKTCDGEGVVRVKVGSK